MEHRNGSRANVTLNANLCQGSRHVGWYRIKNLSSGGVCLTGVAENLANDSMVTVLIEQGRGSNLKKSSLKALVVHQDENSIGLMWAGYEPSYQEIVPELIAHAA